jgi:pyridoxamine 5'-phosphate oxidase
MSIENMRRAYERDGLSEQDMSADPLVQFQQWFEAVRRSDLPEWREVNAMTLSPTDVDGAVTSRTVLLKRVASGRLFFYTNYESDKGEQIAANPRVAFSFFWPHLERQVRILGTASRTNRQITSTAGLVRASWTLWLVASRRSSKVAATWNDG